MSAVVSVNPPALSSQGIRRSAPPLSSEQISSPRNEASSGDNSLERTNLHARSDQESTGGDDTVENLSDPADVSGEDLPENAPNEHSARPSLSSWRSSGSIYQLTRSATNTLEKSKRLHRVIAVISFIAILFTFIGFWPAFGQYWYSKASWDQSNQSSNQTTEWQMFDLKNKYYQTCQLNKMLNSTVEDPGCEEALKGPAPSLPFPYIANPIMSKIKRQILEAICDCPCQNGAEGAQVVPGETNFNPATQSYRTDALDGAMFFFLMITVAVLFLLRKRISIISQAQALFRAGAAKTSPYIFRQPKQVNATEKIDENFGQSSSMSALSNDSTRRRGTAPQEQRRQNLWEAAAAGNMNIVQTHLSSGMFPDIDKVNSRYGTPLCAACEGGDIRIATVLLIKGADVNVSGGRFLVPIQAAAYAGNTTLVRLLLAKGARVDPMGGWSGTALQAACDRGDAEMVREIIAAGSSVNAGGGSFGSPLQAAAARGKVAVVQTLLEKGAEVNAECGEYGCALNAAVASGSREVVDLILESGARLDLPLGDYGNCIQIALRQGYPELARTLLEKGANGNVTDEQGRTPLIEAAILGDEALVNRLLERGVNLDTQDEDKCSALHYVCLEGKEAITKLLIENKANVMLRDKFEGPPLHRAAGGGHLSIVKLLLDHHADVDAKDILGATALHQSAGAQKHVLRFLLSKGADLRIATNMGETPLHSAVNANNLEISKALLDAGADTSTQDNDQATPLFRSVKKGFYHIAKELLNRGADVNIRSAGAFQEAISKGEVELVNLMLEKGANVNAQGNQFGSPLQAAAGAVSNSLQLVSLLLDRQANPNLGGGEYGSALAAACYFGNLAVFRKLLGSGANVNARGGRYGSAIRAAQFGVAAAEEKASTLKELRQHGARDLVGVKTHDDDVWRLTPSGWTWLPT